MAIATPEVYNEMIDRAKAGRFAYPAVNVTSSQTITAALQGFAEAESDGILQVSVGGAEYASGSTVIRNANGSVDVSDIEGPLTVENAFGSIEIDDIDGNLDVEGTHSRVVGPLLLGSRSADGTWRGSARGSCSGFSSRSCSP